MVSKALWGLAAWLVILAMWLGQPNDPTLSKVAERSLIREYLTVQAMCAQAHRRCLP